jgi:hypothetical protein
MCVCAFSVWSPFHVADVRKIEAVQRGFTKLLPGLADFNYSTRLAIFELDGLELMRRLHLDLALAYKLIIELAAIESSTPFEFRSDCLTRGQSGHDYKLTADNNRVYVRKWYFS